MKKIIRTLLVVVLVLAFAIPASLCASAAPDTTAVSGYVHSGGYKSNWVGSTIRHASYGNWVASDGDWNGGVQWGNGDQASKITLDPETGELTFDGVANPNCKIYTGQVAGDKTLAGSALLKFDLYYDSYKAPSGTTEVPRFPGFYIGYITSTAENRLIGADPNGRVYYGNTILPGDSNVFAQLEEGWNTFYLYMIPTFAEDGTTVTNQDVYARVGTKSDPVTETYGVTEKDLQDPELFTHYTYINRTLGGGDNSLGPLLYIKPQVENEGYFKLRNVAAPNLVSGSLLSVRFPDYSKLDAYVSANERQEITLPTAIDPDTGEKVNYWKSTVQNADGTYNYYLPGGTIRVTENFELVAATEEDEKIAELGVALSMANEDEIPNYTYADIMKYMAAIEVAVAKVPDFDASHPLHTSYTSKLAALTGAKNEIASAAEDLIAYAAIFNNSNQSLDARFRAYDAIKDGTFDETYYVSDGDERCKTAISQLASFRTLAEAVQTPYTNYRTDILTLGSADSYQDVIPTIMSALQNLKIVRTNVGPSIVADDILISKYLGDGLDNELAEYLALTTLSDKFAALTELLTGYNLFKEVVYNTRRPSAIPEQVQSAVDDYNEIITTLNNEMVEVALITASLEYSIVPTTGIIILITDIRSKVDALVPVAE